MLSRNLTLEEWHRTLDKLSEEDRKKYERDLVLYGQAWIKTENGRSVYMSIDEARKSQAH